MKADADNPHAPVYARRPVGRLGTCPYWYGVGRLETCPYWCGVGRLETCPYRCGNGREGEGAMLSPLPLPVEERKGSRGKVRSQCRQPARARLRKTAGGQVRNLPLLVRPGGRLETCPSWCGNGREGEGGRGKVRATRRAPQHRH